MAYQSGDGTTTGGGGDSPPVCIEPWLDDNVCDDRNNIAECAFDGGDCCNTTADDSFCALCYCLDPLSPNYEGKTPVF